MIGRTLIPLQVVHALYGLLAVAALIVGIVGSCIGAHVWWFGLAGVAGLYIGFWVTVFLVMAVGILILWIMDEVRGAKDAR